MKKITALLLCCLSLFLFTGCEGSTTSTEPKTETVENQELTLSMKDWDRFSTHGYRKHRNLHW